jgi:hypothetical protein
MNRAGDRKQALQKIATKNNEVFYPSSKKRLTREVKKIVVDIRYNKYKTFNKL